MQDTNTDAERIRFIIEMLTQCDSAFIRKIYNLVLFHFNASKS